MKIIKNPLLIFYLLTLVLSVLLLLGHIFFEEVGTYSISLTQYSPFFALLIIAYFFKDELILKNIKSQMKVNLKMVVPILFLFGTIIVTIILPAITLTYLDVPFVEWPALKQTIGLHIVAIMVGCALEDLGFRGYFFPKLLHRYNWIISSIILGALWGIWHMYLVDGVLGLLLHISFFIMMSLLISYAYLRSGSNLLVIWIWHISFNFLYRLLLWDRLTVKLLIIQNLTVLFCLFCLFIFLYYKKSKYQLST